MDEDHKQLFEDWHKLCDENAALRAEVERLKSSDDIGRKLLAGRDNTIKRWNDLAQHNREASDAQEAEIERLRGALEKIAGDGMGWANSIARAALGDGE